MDHRRQGRFLPILAATTQQAISTFNFTKGIFAEAKRFAAMVDNRSSDTISLKNRVDIQIRPANFRTIRGITAIAAIAEECSMWQSDESKNPDKEILAALRPSLATTGGTLFAIGSPHARKGETWATYRRHYGPDGNPAILVANAATRVFNPHHPPGCHRSRLRGRRSRRGIRVGRPVPQRS